MTESMAIRVATVNDAAALKHCMVSAYSIYNVRMGDSTLPPIELDYVEEITTLPTWVATTNGNLVGGLTMMFFKDHASIANIAVSPSAQGRGLGRNLMTLLNPKQGKRVLVNYAWQHTYC